MADRIVENYTNEVPDMPNALQTVLAESIKIGREKLEGGEALEPFTMIAVSDKLFTEPTEGTSPDQCYANARHNVRGVRGASAYALCYDGYLDTNEGVKDAIIAEGGVPGAEKGFAIACLYESEAAAKGDSNRAAYKFNADPSYIGPAPNFMADLTAPGEEFVSPAVDAFGENAGDIDIEELIDESAKAEGDAGDKARAEVKDDVEAKSDADAHAASGAQNLADASELGGITIDSGLIVDLDTTPDTNAK